MNPSTCSFDQAKKTINTLALEYRETCSSDKKQEIMEYLIGPKGNSFTSPLAQFAKGNKGENILTVYFEADKYFDYDVCTFNSFLTDHFSIFAESSEKDFWATLTQRLVFDQAKKTINTLALEYRETCSSDKKQEIMEYLVGPDGNSFTSPLAQFAKNNKWGKRNFLAVHYGAANYFHCDAIAFWSFLTNHFSIFASSTKMDFWETLTKQIPKLKLDDEHFKSFEKQNNDKNFNGEVTEADLRRREKMLKAVTDYCKEHDIGKNPKTGNFEYFEMYLYFNKPENRGELADAISINQSNTRSLSDTRILNECLRILEDHGNIWTGSADDTIKSHNTEVRRIIETCIQQFKFANSERLEMYNHIAAMPDKYFWLAEATADPNKITARENMRFGQDRLERFDYLLKQIVPTKDASLDDTYEDGEPIHDIKDESTSNMEHLKATELTEQVAALPPQSRVNIIKQAIASNKTGYSDDKVSMIMTLHATEDMLNNEPRYFVEDYIKARETLHNSNERYQEYNILKIEQSMEFADDAEYNRLCVHTPELTLWSEMKECFIPPICCELFSLCKFPSEADIRSMGAKYGVDCGNRAFRDVATKSYLYNVLLTANTLSEQAVTTNNNKR